MTSHQKTYKTRALQCDANTRAQAENGASNSPLPPFHFSDKLPDVKLRVIWKRIHKYGKLIKDLLQIIS